MKLEGSIVTHIRDSRICSRTIASIPLKVRCLLRLDFLNPGHWKAKRNPEREMQEAMRFRGKLSRICRNTTVALTLSCFYWMQIVTPVEALADDMPRTASAPLYIPSPGVHSTPMFQPTNKTLAPQERLRRLLASIIKKSSAASIGGESYAAEREELRAIASELDVHDRAMAAQYDVDLKHIKSSHLAMSIRHRHNVSAATVRAESTFVRTQLESLATADEKSFSVIAKQLNAHLEQLRSPQPRIVDPKKLPFKVASGAVRKPLATAKELKEVLARHLNISNSAPIPELTRTNITQNQFSQIERAAGDGDFDANSIEPIEVASIGPMSGLMLAC